MKKVYTMLLLSGLINIAYAKDKVLYDNVNAIPLATQQIIDNNSVQSVLPHYTIQIFNGESGALLRESKFSYMNLSEIYTADNSMIPIKELEQDCKNMTAKNMDCNNLAKNKLLFNIHTIPFSSPQRPNKYDFLIEVSQSIYETVQLTSQMPPIINNYRRDRIILITNEDQEKEVMIDFTPNRYDTCYNTEIENLFKPAKYKIAIKKSFPILPKTILNNK